MTISAYDHLSYWPEIQSRTAEAVAADLTEAIPGLKPEIAKSAAEDLMTMASPFEVRTKDDLWNAIIRTGPYARMRLYLNVMDTGRFAKDDLLHMFPTVWKASRFYRVSDRMLTLWERLSRNGRQPWYDDDMPDGRYIEVFRGQDARFPAGFSWTTDRTVAERHAYGDHVRKVDAPVVLSGRVPRRLILGYVAGMQEAEVIVAPIAVRSGPRNGPRIEALS